MAWSYCKLYLSFTSWVSSWLLWIAIVSLMDHSRMHETWARKFIVGNVLQCSPVYTCPALLKHYGAGNHECMAGFQCGVACLYQSIVAPMDGLTWIFAVWFSIDYIAWFYNVSLYFIFTSGKILNKLNRFFGRTTLLTCWCISTVVFVYHYHFL